MTKTDRINNANKLIETIASCGRHFFSMTGKQEERPSHFEINGYNGRMYFYDKYTYEALPLSHTKSKRWQKSFSEGGTLLYLVECLADYIRTGKPISASHFTWPEDFCKGDLWGYGSDMVKVREAAKMLRIIEA